MLTRSRLGYLNRISRRWYFAVIIASIFSGFVYGASRHGLFACQPANAEGNQFTSYCHASAYGDYDHGAFWFGLEPRAVSNASSADVLFLGNSRMQIGMSTDVVRDWFDNRAVDFFLLGFTHGENQMFAEPLLQKLAPEAGVYIINVDGFFEEELKGPADDVINNPLSRNRYEQKQTWQAVHRNICNRMPAFCRNEVTYIRSMDTGAMQILGNSPDAESAIIRPLLSGDYSIDQEQVEDSLLQARRFLRGLPGSPNCLILTNVPNSDTSAGTALALAEDLDLPIVAPHTEDLATFDGSHLTHESALSWSMAFVELLGPALDQCHSRAARL